MVQASRSQPFCGGWLFLTHTACDERCPKGAPFLGIARARFSFAFLAILILPASNLPPGRTSQKFSLDSGSFFLPFTHTTCRCSHSISRRRELPSRLHLPADSYKIDCVSTFSNRTLRSTQTILLFVFGSHRLLSTERKQKKNVRPAITSTFIRTMKKER